MPTWKSRGLRGSTLEDFINQTNETYREHGLALIQKIPTPITPVNIDQTTRHITLAYFDQKSTVDYIGVVQGIPVCFDAKECNTLTFPLQNIHQQYQITRVVASVYASTNFYGRAGMDELFNQTRKIFMNDTLADEQSVFHKQIAFNF